MYGKKKVFAGKDKKGELCFVNSEEDERDELFFVNSEEDKTEEFEDGPIKIFIE